MKIFSFFLLAFCIFFLLNELYAIRVPKIPSIKNGPSGKPARHFKDYPNRKAAEDAARDAGKGI